MLHIKFMEMCPPVPEKRVFKGFYHIGAWRQSWSCDQYATNKTSLLVPKEALHKIWLSSGKRFQKRRCLNIVDDGWKTVDGWKQDHEYPKNSTMSLLLR